MGRRCKSLWGDFVGTIDRGLCFIVIPFESRFDEVFASLVEVCKKLGFRCVKAPDASGSPIIMRGVWESLCKAETVIADMSGLNPNVIYELGLADAVRGDSVIRITRDDPSKLPFDQKDINVIQYAPGKTGMAVLRQEVESQLKRFCFIRKVRDRVEQDERCLGLTRVTDNPQWDCSWELVEMNVRVLRINLRQPEDDRRELRLDVVFCPSSGLRASDVAAEMKRLVQEICGERVQNYYSSEERLKWRSYVDEVNTADIAAMVVNMATAVKKRLESQSNALQS